ncbi:HPr family phosphocarrier protein [Streptosporangium lutulentum]
MPERTVVIASSSGLHARPAKIFVQAAAKQGVPVRIRVGDGKSVLANSMLAVLALGAVRGTEVTLDAEGPGADEALASSPSCSHATSTPRKPSMAETLRGLGVSPGRAAGRVYRMAGPPPLPAPARAVEADRELSEALRALEATAAELAARAERAPDSTAGEILEAQSFIARDPGLYESVEANVRAGMDAAHAIDAACAHHRRALLEAGGYFAERASDLDDIRNRAVAVVLGLPMPGIPDPGHPFVLVAEDLAPADTVNLDPALVLALLTEKGGPTSHTAILARARALPAVVACRG